MLTVTQVRTSDALIHYKVLSENRVAWMHGNVVVEVFLILVQRVVLIDILHVGRGLIRSVVAFRTRITVRRVSLWHIDTLVAFQNGGFTLVEVTAAEVVVVIIGGIGSHGLIGRVAHRSLNILQESLIVTVAALFLIRQTVETHVLTGTRTTGCGKRIGYSGSGRNLTPLRGSEGTAAVNGHAALIEFLTVTQHILTHFSQVNVEFTAITAVAACIGKGIHHPELNVFNVGSLKVIGVQFTHHSAPSLLRIGQCAVGIQIGIQVIGTTLLRIIGQIQNRQCRCGTVITALVAVWIKLSHIHFTHIMVGKLFQVAADMSGCQRRTLTGKERVNVIP